MAYTPQPRTTTMTVPTGLVTITTIDPSSFAIPLKDGDMLIMIFQDNVTVKNLAPSVPNQMHLSGNDDFVVAVGYTLTLTLVGTLWVEQSRTQM